MNGSVRSGTLRVGQGIEVTRRGLDVGATVGELAALREAFARDHVVRLRGFFGAPLLAAFRARVKDAAFSRRIEQGVEIEHTLEEPAPLALTVVALNDPALFDVIDRITGCGSIGCFTGRVQLRQASANGGHYFPWHTDAVQERLVGLSVNLSEHPFEGGILQLRRRRSKSVIAEVDNPTAGDAVIFRISRDLEHHVTPVTTAAPRLVLAGWFRRSPDFWRKAGVCAAS